MFCILLFNVALICPEYLMNYWSHHCWLLFHSKKLLDLTVLPGRSLSVWSLSVFPMSMLVLRFPPYAFLLPQTWWLGPLETVYVVVWLYVC